MSTLLRRAGEPRRVSPEPLNVAPALVGRPLASPLRRAVAMGLDLLVVALLSGASGVWLALGLLAVAWQLRGTAAAPSRTRAWAGRALVTVFVLLAALEAWDGLSGRAGSREAPDADEAPVAATAPSASASASGSAAVSAPASAVASGAAASAASAVPFDADAAQRRIDELQAELAEARQPRPLKWRDELRQALDAVGASFGWGVVYFSLLPAFWNGQTLGKRLLGLQVVELTGRPMTVMRCLRRYGGYAAGMATGGLGFAQAWWDLNHQGIQDRTAHTVVLDLRDVVPPPPPLPPASADEPASTAPSTDATPSGPANV